MAVAVLEHGDQNNSVTRPTRRLDRRHYKKDSRFVLDLYTLTYDSHESLDSLGDLIERRFEVTYLQHTENDAEIVRMEENGKNAKNDIITSGYRCRKSKLQPRLPDGQNLPLYLLNQQSFEWDDHQLEDGTLSLPIFQSKCVLNNQEITSLPIEKQEIPTNVVTRSYPEMNLHFVEGKNDSSKDTKNTGNKKCEVGDEICSVMRNECAATTKSKTISDCRQRSGSPVTCIIKTSLKKVAADDRNSLVDGRRMNRQTLFTMNSNQLQSIIDDLHTHVEYLNEQLMKMLMERDELHMKRDALLVDIEDITAHLDTKQVYEKSNFKNCFSNAKYTKKSNVYKTMMPSTCTKNIKFGLRFNRLTSYIRN